MVQKIRLAESLVAQGIITEEQLQKALQRQLIMGGKIGTNLIELSFISEDQLAEALSRIFHVPPASDRLFQNIPQSLINSIPRDIAVKHMIIPVRKVHNVLTLAMENPSDFAVIDELSFMTGCRISAVLATEIRIWLELEKHYKHPRPMRFIHLNPGKEPFTMERGLGDAAPTPAPIGEEKTAIIMSAEDEWLGGMDDEPVYTFGYHKAGKPLNEEKAVRKIIHSPRTLQETVTLLSDVGTRDDAIKTVLDYISQIFDNVIFFVISVAEAKAWSASCKGIDDSTLSELKVSFGGPSIFLTVKNNEKPYYGDISGFPFDDEFLGRTGRKRPLKVLLMPIMVKTKMVAMLYVDNGTKEMPPGKIAEVKSLKEKLSIAFEILLLKRKAGRG